MFPALVPHEYRHTVALCAQVRGGGPITLQRCSGQSDGPLLLVELSSPLRQTISNKMRPISAWSVKRIAQPLVFTVHDAGVAHSARVVVSAQRNAVHILMTGGFHAWLAILLMAGVELGRPAFRSGVPGILPITHSCCIVFHATPRLVASFPNPLPLHRVLSLKVELASSSPPRPPVFVAGSIRLHPPVLQPPVASTTRCVASVFLSRFCPSF